MQVHAFGALREQRRGDVRRILGDHRQPAVDRRALGVVERARPGQHHLSRHQRRIGGELRIALAQQ